MNKRCSLKKEDIHHCQTVAMDTTDNHIMEIDKARVTDESPTCALRQSQSESINPTGMGSMRSQIANRAIHRITLEATDHHH